MIINLFNIYQDAVVIILLILLAFCLLAWCVYTEATKGVHK